MKNIRNFSIIAHIDHGKTTLTDRILEFTGTVKASHATRIVDSNPIEQERGITIKLAPVRLDYKGYILNLIDTPGHVDFAYEVSRSLKACDGAVLVVDATKGIQAQTLANYDKAVEHNLHIIPVINKIDLDSAEPEKTADELVSILGFKKEDILYVSAKTGVGVEGLLDAITAKVPPPRISPSKDNELKALVFNSTFDIHKGVIAFVEVVQGQINSQNLDRLVLYQAQEPMNPLEIGFFTPLMTASSILNTGEVGYIATGHKDIRYVTIGDTVTTKGSLITPIEGYERPLPMVFMDLYPGDAGDFRLLATALEKLALNDASLTFTITASPALGHGFRVGFLGILHAEIVSERLFQEFGVSCVNTTPSVPYRLTLSNYEHSEISSPADYPTPESIKEVQEPFILLTIYTPESYVGAVMELAQTKRAEFIDMQYPAPGKAKLEYLMPLAELITNFYVDFINMNILSKSQELVALILLYALIAKDFSVFKYVSFFKYFNKEYEGWKSGVITASYYWSSGYAQTDMLSRILLQILISAYEEVDGMAHEYVFEKELNKSNNIENSILKLDEIFSKEDLRKRHPNVSDATIDRTLKRLKDEDKIRPLGKGRSSKWQRIVSGNRKFGVEQLSLFND